MWSAVSILAGCCLWVSVLGQKGPRPERCGRRWKPQTPPDGYQQQKTEAPPNSWPWHVGVYSSALGPYPYCGGTLLKGKWVLTAAHCVIDVLDCNVVPFGQFFSYHDVTGRDMAVRIADHKFTPRERPGYNVRVKNAIIHPYFTNNTASAGFDIALLELNRKVKRSSRTEYACLPESNLNLTVGHYCNFAGWGQIPNPPNVPYPGPSQNLMEVQIPIAPTTQCGLGRPYFNENQAFCTDGRSGVLCNGDSGGGLHCLTPDRSKWVVYGVYSFGPAGCKVGTEVFAFTKTHLAWIASALRAHP